MSVWVPLEAFTVQPCPSPELPSLGFGAQLCTQVLVCFGGQLVPCYDPTRW